MFPSFHRKQIRKTLTHTHTHTLTEREKIEITMVMQNERGQNTQVKGERVKIPLLPNNVGKRSVNAGPMITSNLKKIETCLSFCWTRATTIFKLIL